MYEPVLTTTTVCGTTYVETRFLDIYTRTRILSKLRRLS